MSQKGSIQSPTSYDANSPIIRNIQPQKELLTLKKRHTSIKLEISPPFSQVNNETPKSTKTLSSSKGSGAKPRQQLLIKDTWTSPGNTRLWKSPSSVKSKSTVEELDSGNKKTSYQDLKAGKFPKKKNLSSVDPLPVASITSLGQDEIDRKPFVPTGKWAHDRAKSSSNQIIYEVEEEKGTVDKEEGSSLHNRKASSTQFRASQLSVMGQDVSDVSEVPEERSSTSKIIGLIEHDETFRLKQIITSEGDMEPIDHSVSYDTRNRVSDIYSSKGYRK